jgi:hypothetical protein
MIKFAPRYFILPLIALVVIGSLPAPAGSGARRDTGCGPALTGTTDRTVHRTFEQFQRRQSAAADKICAAHRNAMAFAIR